MWYNTKYFVRVETKYKLYFLEQEVNALLSTHVPDQLIIIVIIIRSYSERAWTINIEVL